MLWLIAAILAYFLFAIASIGDKRILAGPPNPKVYAFYVGILGVFALLLIPFVNFYIPGINLIILSFFAGIVSIAALLAIYEGLERFEVSRMIPALGGFMPIFTLLLAYFIIGEQDLFGWQKLMSFLFLLIGSVLISLESSLKFSFKSLIFAALSAFLLSLYFVLSKILYLSSGFWPVFIWIRITSFIAALFLIIFKDVRLEIFRKKTSFSKKTSVLFISTQIAGGTAVVLQNWAIALASVAFLPFISALQGVQYIFLFLMTALISLNSPEILKEKISKKIMAQKVFAIILIAMGLATLVL